LKDIIGICPIILQQMIHLEDNAEPYRDRQRMLNPTLQEVVRKEILKSLYITIKNAMDELIPTRIQFKWCVCINHGKFNSALERITSLYPSWIKY